MHKDVVVILQEAGIYRMEGKGFGQETFSRLGPVDRSFEFPEDLGIIEQADIVLKYDRIDQTAQGIEVVHRLKASKGLLSPLDISRRTATALGRTGVAAISADWIALARL